MTLSCADCSCPPRAFYKSGVVSIECNKPFIRITVLSDLISIQNFPETSKKKEHRIVIRCNQPREERVRDSIYLTNLIV